MTHIEWNEHALRDLEENISEQVKSLIEKLLPEVVSVHSDNLSLAIADLVSQLAEHGVAMPKEKAAELLVAFALGEMGLTYYCAARAMATDSARRQVVEAARNALTRGEDAVEAMIVEARAAGLGELDRSWVADFVKVLPELL